MRILTRTQYDAICDIVTEQKKIITELETEQKKRITELETELEKCKQQVKDLKKSIDNKNQAIEYVNDQLFKRTKQCLELQKAATTTSVTVDYPNSAAYFH